MNDHHFFDLASNIHFKFYYITSPKNVYKQK